MGTISADCLPVKQNNYDNNGHCRIGEMRCDEGCCGSRYHCCDGGLCCPDSQHCGNTTETTTTTSTTTTTTTTTSTTTLTLNSTISSEVTAEMVTVKQNDHVNNGRCRIGRVEHSRSEIH